MSRISLYLETTRPKTLIVSLAPMILVATYVAPKTFDAISLLLSTTLSVLLIQILTNYYNDYFDLKKGSDTDDRKGPKRPFQRGDLSEVEMKKMIYLLTITYAISVIPIICKLKLVGAFLALLCYLLSIYYTKGNYSLAYLGISDIFSFLFFGPIATSVTGYLLTNQFQLPLILIGCFTGALSTIILTVNHLRDEIEDGQANKRTLVVRFGERFGLYEILILVWVARLLPLVIFEWNLVTFTCVILIGITSQQFLNTLFLCKNKPQFALLLKDAAIHFFIQLNLMWTLCVFSHFKV
jgi:1,4-dihydroxy-2-naphthoate octaprenyltransferase